MKVWLAFALILVGALALAVCAGHEWATPFDLVRAVAGDADIRSRLLVEWRMPRVLAAAFVGVLLGLGGAVFQGVFRNPLAEPYLLGSAGGAALGATIALLVPVGVSQSLLLPLLAFAGAWGATVFVIAVSRVDGNDWWAPNGEALANPPETGPRIVYLNAQQPEYRLLVEFTGSDRVAFTTRPRSQSSGSWRAGRARMSRSGSTRKRGSQDAAGPRRLRRWSTFCLPPPSR